jgi:succinate-acetate transporter protein
MGAVATTLLTISFGMLSFRDVTLQAPVFVADLCFAAGAGLVISAQWEMLKGNTFSYTVLMAFGTNARGLWQKLQSGMLLMTITPVGFFYAGYGYVTIPSTGIADFYGGTSTPSFNNALGAYVLVWACFNFFFLICTIRMYVLELQKHLTPLSSHILTSH